MTIHSIIKKQNQLKNNYVIFFHEDKSVGFKIANSFPSNVISMPDQPLEQRVQRKNFAW